MLPSNGWLLSGGKKSSGVPTVARPRWYYVRSQDPQQSAMRYLAGVVLPLSLWAGSRTIYERVEAALTNEERLRRHHQNRDRGIRSIRARNQ